MSARVALGVLALVLASTWALKASHGGTQSHTEHTPGSLTVDITREDVSQ